jgi:hypothetical protein
MYDSATCKPYSTWYAWVCPPGYNHRVITFTDQTYAEFTGNLDTVLYVIIFRKKSKANFFLKSNTMSAKIYRFPEKIPFTMTAKMAVEYTTGSLQYFKRDYHQANLLMNYNYVMTWGSGKTPNLAAVNVMTPRVGEWIRLVGIRFFYGFPLMLTTFFRIGMPYPAGTTFDFKGSEITRTQANSFGQLAYNTYFYDSATKLLWIHVEVIFVVIFRRTPLSNFTVINAFRLNKTLSVMITAK